MLYTKLNPTVKTKMWTETCRQRMRNTEVTENILLTNIFKHTSRGVQYQMYPLDSCCGFPPMKKIHKVLLAYHVIALLRKVTVIKIVNKVIQMHNSAENNLCNLLADQSIEFLMDRNRIKGVHHINILIKDSKHIVTKENDYISTLYIFNLDYISTTFMDYASIK